MSRKKTSKSLAVKKKRRGGFLLTITCLSKEGKTSVRFLFEKIRKLWDKGKRSVPPRPSLLLTQRRLLKLYHQDHFRQQALAFLLILVLVLSNFRSHQVLATTYTFAQSSWAGGQSASLAIHPGDQSGWNKYESKDANLNIVGGNSLQLSAATASTTQTDDTASSTGFNLAGSSFASTTVIGSGDDASVKLTSTKTNLDRRLDYSIGATPSFSAFDSYTNSLWVTSGSSNSIKKINPSTGEVLGTYTVGTTPAGAAFDPSTNSVWVANSGSDNISKVNVSTGEVIGTYNVGDNPYGVAFDSYTSSIWVSNYYSSNIMKINPANGSIIGTYSTSNAPMAVVFDPSTNSIWVGDVNGSQVRKLQASDGSLVGTYAGGGRDLAYDSSTQSIWAVSFSGGYVTKLKASDGSNQGSFGSFNYPYSVAFDPITNSIWVGQTNGRLWRVRPSDRANLGAFSTGGTNPLGMTFDPISNSIWIMNSATSTISRLRVSIGTNFQGPYAVGTNPQGMIYESISNSLWVANYGSANVTKVNPLTGATIGTYAVGTNPSKFAFDSDSNSLWVLNNGSNNVSKINPVNGAVLGTYPVGNSGSNAIAYDSHTNSIWVTNQGVNLVTKMSATSGAVISTSSVGTNPNGVVFDSITNSIFVKLANGSTLYKLDSSDGSLVATTTIASNSTDIAYDYYTNSVWTSDYYAAVRKINPLTLSQSSSYQSSQYNTGMTFDSTNNTIWFGDGYYYNQISAVNAVTGEYLNTISTSSSRNLAFDPITNSLWISLSTGLMKVNVASVVYDSSGTYTSSVLDLGQNASSFSTLAFSSTVPANTTLTIDVRAGDSPTVDGTWTSWQTSVSNDGDISGLGSGHRYVQYRANLGTTDTMYTPSLDSLTFNYNTYSSSQSLTSSSFDTTDNANVIGSLAWIEDATLPQGTGVTFSLRTASTQEELATAAWSDFTNVTPHCAKVGSTVTCPNAAIPEALKSGGDDRFWQYKIALASAGDLSPSASGVEVKYVVNAPPELQNVTASQGSNGKVNISYDVRDSDTLAGTNTPGKITPSFEYWNGDSWTACATLSANATTTKDVDTTSFTTYTLTWDPKVDYNNHYLTDAKIRIKANDNEAANNLVTLDSATFTLDTNDPVMSSIVGDARTDASNALTLTVAEDTLAGLKMKLSNHSDLTADGANSDSGQWIDYAPTKDWTFSTEANIVYYQLKDAYGNLSSNGAISAVVLPAKPANILFQDVSNIETSEWREFIAWGKVSEPPAGFKQYNIYRSTDGTNFTLLEPPQTDRSTNFILNADLNTSLVYYYKVTAEDDNGNVSFYSNTISDRPDGQGGTDLTPPAISNIQISQITAQSALITWETDEPSDSSVSYITNDSGKFTNAPNVGLSSMADIPSRLGSHAIFLNHLDPGVRYYIQVDSADPNHNQATGGTGLFFNALAGPVISDVKESNLQNAGITISWTTSQAADSRVYYSLDPDFSAPADSGLGDNTTNHSVNLIGLSPATTYYYYVKSGVAEDKNIIEGEANYYSFTTTSDLVPPTISFSAETDITNLSETTARITWQTDELATSSLEYSTDDSYSNILSNPNLNTDHAFDLTGLTKGTLYNFRLKSWDVNGNPSVLSGYNFSTPDLTDRTAPNITFNQESDLTNLADTSVHLHFLTTEAASSSIEYGPSDSYASSTSNTNFNTDHNFDLAGLIKGTLYHFRLLGGDASGNATSTPDYTFTTPDHSDVIPPVITFDPETGLTGLSETAATISWTTNELASSTLEYSADSSYSNVLTKANLNTDHSFHLTGLTKGTLYNFRLKNVDASGNLATLENLNFSTPDLTDRTPPVITFDPETNVTSITDTSAHIAWTTSEYATSTIEYSADLSYGHALTSDHFNTDQAFDLSSLAKGRTYNFRLTSADASGNATTTANYTFTTSDHTDLTPPTISGVTASQVSDTTALITWTTDESADSKVNYGTETGSYIASSTSAVLNLSHSILLSGLTKQTKYYFQVQSSDANSNLATSTEADFTTRDKLTEGQASSTTIYIGGGGATIINNAKVDPIPPTISKVEVKDLSATEATISWQTDELADSIVEFGDSDSYGYASVNLSLANSHSQDLLNLFPQTLYHYKVVSTDGSGNRSAASTGTFTTPAFSATELDLKASPNSPEEQAATDANFSDILKRTFDYLKQAAKSVSVSILEASLIDQENSLKELAGLAPAPQLTSGPSVKTWEDMVIISWATDKKTSSLVNYSESGVSLNDSQRAQTIGNPDLYSTEHQVIISGLKAATTYNYELKGSTIIGSLLKSEPRSFTTLSKAAKVDNYVTDTLTDESASFKWSSSLPTDTSIRITPYRNNSLSTDESRLVSDANLTTLHQMTVSDLEPGVFYKIDLFGKDQSGKTLSQTIEAFSTINKELPFLIEQVKTSSALAAGNSLQVQSIISWDTTKLSTSKVYYREGTSQDDNYWPKESNLDTGYTRHHLIIMTDFNPGQIYQFQVESSDSNGQKVRSKTYTVLTPRQKESVFQVILKNIEQTFGWMGGQGGE